MIARAAAAAAVIMVIALARVAWAAAPTEHHASWTTAGGTVRILANTPANFDPARPTQLIIYATPNGNSAEQTLGARIEPGMDWRYDIQHIAAQVRKLRQIDSSQNIVLACLEAEKLSWPAWRKARPDNGKIIRSIAQDVRRKIPGREPRITLTGHSGGGSFIFGYLNGGDAIDANIDRIAWLDANYAYDEQEKHGEKLLAWLKGDPKRHLIVIAYDDSQITLNGKPVLKTPMGGTFGSSKRMIEWLENQTPLEKSTRGPFETWHGLAGQVRFLIHNNPQKKILHTVLVERNGLLEAMTLGTARENKWGGEFLGPRAYAEHIRTLAATRPATNPNSVIPPRPQNAPGGKAFAESIAKLPPQEREAAIVREITGGNLPEFLRNLATVHFEGVDGGFHVMPDYLAVGSDADFVRMPMTPQSAAAIADALGFSLPTRKMVDDIYRAADVKLEPKPLTEKREAVETFVQHNDIIERQRAATAAGKPLGVLVAGHKKDIVLSNRLNEKPNKVAIYGWHKLDGKPIQPLYVGHADHYVDYSHGVRLVKNMIFIETKPHEIQHVLRDPKLSELISDEGPIDARYR